MTHPRNILTKRIPGLVAGILWTSLLSAVSVDIQVYKNSTCGRPDGEVYAEVYGGLPPYTVLWDDGESGQFRDNLYPGTHNVYVTDGLGGTATGTVEILTVDYGDGTMNSWTYAACGEVPAHMYFFAGLDADGNPFPDSPYGPGPYSFNIGGVDLPYELVQDCSNWTSYFFLTLPQGVASATINFTDGLGCPGYIEFYPPLADPPLPAIQVLDVQGACAGSPSGAARIRVPSGTPGRELRMRIRRDDGAFIPSACYSYTVGFFLYDQVHTNLAPGTYWVILDVDRFGALPDYYTACADSVSFTIPDLGDDCTTVSGRVYVDSNGDCAMGPTGSEARVANTPVEFTPGPFFLSTDANGVFSGVLPDGAYTVAVAHPVLAQSCAVTANLTGGVSNNVNVGMAAGAPLDLLGQLTSGTARPGFEISYGMAWENLTSMAPGAITISLMVDPMLSLTSVGNLPAPTVNGNIYSWTGSSVDLNSAFQQKTNTARFLVPADIQLLGTMLEAQFTVSAVNTDADLNNNTAVVQTVITGSYDPNDKLARTSSGETEAWVNEVDEWIDYTIRFQNTGTDTAFHVAVTDTLPATLDPATLRWGPLSHSGSAKLSGQGVLTISFLNIQLPDSNVNEPKSHGYVGFRIKPREGLAPGTLIENVANIFFDFNPPVITDPSVLEVVPPPVRLDVWMLLGGAYEPVEGLMRDDLRTMNLLPWQEPYTALGYAHAGGGGNEAVPPLRLVTTGSEAIVDWVVVELRDADNPATVLHSKSVLLRRDGKVVATDGRSAVSIQAMEGDYYVALRHRNHLGVMTASPVPLGLVPTTIDLADAGTATWGTDARMTVGTIRALWPGDITLDGAVKYTGATNDRDRILQDIGGALPNAVQTGYHGSDVNLDGTIQYTGTGNDRDMILLIIGGEVPTKVVQEQLPE